MESLVSVLRRTVNHLRAEFIEERTITKDRILHSEEYLELRGRFKRFIDQYNDMKNENATLKKLVDSKETELVLS